MGKQYCGSFAASVRMRGARLLFQVSLSLWGRPILFLKDWGPEGLSFKKRSRHCPAIAQARRARSPALPYPPARPIDCPQETEWKSTIEFNLHRDLYRRGVKLLTINKERT